MIQWIKLDRENPPIQGVRYLITDGQNVEIALFADDLWFVPDMGLIDDQDAITHYAEINLPQLVSVRVRYFVFNAPYYALIAAPYKLVALKTYAKQVGELEDAEVNEIIEVDRGHALALFRKANPELSMPVLLGKFDQYKNAVLLIDKGLL